MSEQQSIKTTGLAAEEVVTFAAAQPFSNGRICICQRSINLQSKKTRFVGDQHKADFCRVPSRSLPFLQAACLPDA